METNGSSKWNNDKGKEIYPNNPSHFFSILGKKEQVNTRHRSRQYGKDLKERIQRNTKRKEKETSQRTSLNLLVDNDLLETLGGSSSSWSKSLWFCKLFWLLAAFASRISYLVSRGCACFNDSFHIKREDWNLLRYMEQNLFNMKKSWIYRQVCLLKSP